MKLIDVDNIGLTDFDIIVCNGSYKEAFTMLLDKIYNAPTIDAVPVIRCVNCEHWDHDTLNINNYGPNCFCIMVEHRTAFDFFCGDGKREEVLK